MIISMSGYFFKQVTYLQTLLNWSLEQNKFTKAKFMPIRKTLLGETTIVRLDEYNIYIIMSLAKEKKIVCFDHITMFCCYVVSKLEIPMLCG